MGTGLRDDENKILRSVSGAKVERRAAVQVLTEEVQTANTPSARLSPQCGREDEELAGGHWNIHQQLGHVENTLEAEMTLLVQGQRQRLPLQSN